jgi:hypothetical protein
MHATNVPNSELCGSSRVTKMTPSLQIVDTGNLPPSSCKPMTAAGLQVFPPNQTRSKTVPFPFSACSGKGPVYLSVQPVTK